LANELKDNNINIELLCNLVKSIDALKRYEIEFIMGKKNPTKNPTKRYGT
jgi:hypothetical protein